MTTINCTQDISKIISSANESCAPSAGHGTPLEKAIKQIFNSQQQHPESNQDSKTIDYSYDPITDLQKVLLEEIQKQDETVRKRLEKSSEKLNKTLFQSKFSRPEKILKTVLL